MGQPGRKSTGEEDQMLWCPKPVVISFLCLSILSSLWPADDDDARDTKTLWAPTILCHQGGWPAGLLA